MQFAFKLLLKFKFKHLDTTGRILNTTFGNSSFVRQMPADLKSTLAALLRTYKLVVVLIFIKMCRLDEGHRFH